jgi:hypothetical protein
MCGHTALPLTDLTLQCWPRCTARAFNYSYTYYRCPPRWCFHLIVVRGLEYARDPESYTSGSVATGRASLAGQVKG